MAPIQISTNHLEYLLYIKTEMENCMNFSHVPTTKTQQKSNSRHICAYSCFYLLIWFDNEQSSREEAEYKGVTVTE